MTPNSDPPVVPAPTPVAKEDAKPHAEQVNHVLVEFLGSWSECFGNRQREESP